MSPGLSLRPPGPLGEAALYFPAKSHLLDVGFFACKLFLSRSYISDNLTDSID